MGLVEIEWSAHLQNISFCIIKLAKNTFLYLKKVPCVRTKLTMFSLSGEIKNQISCSPSAVAILERSLIFCTWLFITDLDISFTSNVRFSAKSKKRFEAVIHV